MTKREPPSLKRQIRRLLTAGIPSVLLGAAALGGAIWWGLDYTGIALLVFGILLSLLGVFLLFVAVTSTLAVVEASLRRRFRRRRPGMPAAQVPRGQPPVLPPTVHLDAAAPPAPAPPHDEPPRRGPLIF